MFGGLLRLNPDFQLIDSDGSRGLGILFGQGHAKAVLALHDLGSRQLEPACRELGLALRSEIDTSLFGEEAPRVDRSTLTCGRDY